MTSKDKITTRGRILRALDAGGWTVDTYLSSDTIDATSPAGEKLRVEFSSRGGITWAGISGRKPALGVARDTTALGSGKLAQVLGWVEG